MENIVLILLMHVIIGLIVFQLSNGRIYVENLIKEGLVELEHLRGETPGSFGIKIAKIFFTLLLVLIWPVIPLLK